LEEDKAQSGDMWGGETMLGVGQGVLDIAEFWRTAPLDPIPTARVEEVVRAKEL
jgi:hypothetical protein